MKYINALQFLSIFIRSYIIVVRILVQKMPKSLKSTKVKTPVLHMDNNKKALWICGSAFSAHENK